MAGSKGLNEDVTRQYMLADRASLLLDGEWRICLAMVDLFCMSNTTDLSASEAGTAVCGLAPITLHQYQLTHKVQGALLLGHLERTHKGSNNGDIGHLVHLRHLAWFWGDMEVKRRSPGFNGADAGLQSCIPWSWRRLAMYWPWERRRRRLERSLWISRPRSWMVNPKSRSLKCWDSVDCVVLGVDCKVNWEILDAGDTVGDEGEVIWLISFSLRKHLASIWPRREQKSHLWRLALPCELADDVEEEEREGEVNDAWESFWDGFCEVESTEKDVDVLERLVCIRSMFRSDWMTDCLSNLSDDDHNIQLQEKWTWLSNIK